MSIFIQLLFNRHGNFAPAHVLLEKNRVTAQRSCNKRDPKQCDQIKLFLSQKSVINLRVKIGQNRALLACFRPGNDPQQSGLFLFLFLMQHYSLRVAGK
jgi:hypothetical protein